MIIYSDSENMSILPWSGRPSALNGFLDPFEIFVKKLATLSVGK